MRTKPIPGPGKLPLVGNLLEFWRNPPEFLTRIAREYGDVAQFHLGRHPMVQVNHPDLIRRILVTDASNFEKTRGLKRAAEVVGDGLLTSEGELHHRQRRLMQPAFTRERLAGFGAIITDCTERMSSEWQSGAVVNMFDSMLQLTLVIVGRTLFGIDVKDNAPEVGDALTEVFEYFNRTMVPLPQFLKNANFGRRRRFVEAKARLDSIVKRSIEERRKSQDDSRDFLAMILAARDVQGDGSGMSDQLAADEAMTMFLAGHETTATTLTWVWYLLSQNPHVEARLHAEFEEVLGGRTPQVEDLDRLTYTRMVVAESMRVFPPAWTLTRRALQDFEIGEYLIPAGTVVGMSQYVTHRDPRFYDRPEIFDPLRWTDEQVSQRPKYAYFPFGAGPRVCIGERFAWMEIMLLLATLGQRWTAQAVSEKKPVKLHPLITLRPRGGMPMLLSERIRPNGEVPKKTPQFPLRETEERKLKTVISR